MSGAALLGWLALGAPTGLAFWRARRPELALAILPIAGGLAIVLPWLVAPWLGNELAGWPWQSALAALGLGVASAAGLARRQAVGIPPLPSPLAPGTALALAVPIAVAALLLATGWRMARGWPGYGWDGLAIWLVRARVLAESSAFPAELFREPQLAQGHWEYPLLLPALLAWFARFGALELRALVIPLALLAGIVPLATALGLARRLSPPRAAAAALAPLALPGLLVLHFRASADPLLVLALTGALAWSLAGAVHRDRALLVAGSWALAFVVALKDEGALWAVAVSLAAGALVARDRGGVRGLAEAAGLAAPGLAFFAAWQATVAQLGAASPLVAELRFDQLGARVAPLAGAFASTLLAPAPVALGLVALGLCFVGVPGSAAQRAARAGALAAAPAIYALGLFAVYLGSPHALDWHLPTSLHRTLYGVAPALFAGALLAPALGRSRSRS